uniref:Uncharacterized protein n=1 Tax=Romanomermis culicivorax TaxID=13658 RepID=A0A915IF75_ROMCU
MYIPRPRNDTAKFLESKATTVIKKAYVHIRLFNLNSNDALFRENQCRLNLYRLNTEQIYARDLQGEALTRPNRCVSFKIFYILKLTEISPQEIQLSKGLENGLRDWIRNGFLPREHKGRFGDISPGKQEYRESMPASSYQQQKLRVCDVCGAFLGIHDNDRRLADHFGGKLHMGFVFLREKMAELKTNETERRLARDKDRQSSRRRSRSPRDKDRYGSKYRDDYSKRHYSRRSRSRSRDRRSKSSKSKKRSRSKSRENSYKRSRRSRSRSDKEKSSSSRRSSRGDSKSINDRTAQDDSR